MQVFLIFNLDSAGLLYYLHSMILNFFLETFPHYIGIQGPTVRLDKISTHLIELQIIIINSYFISDLSTFIDICIPTSFDWFLGTLFHITTYLLRNIFTFFLISCATLLFSFAMLKWTKKKMILITQDYSEGNGYPLYHYFRFSDFRHFFSAYIWTKKKYLLQSWIFVHLLKIY